MRRAFISDIHGNLKALESALKQIKADEIYCLGDIVDIGSDSNKCIELVRKYCKASILGNHEVIAVENGYTDLQKAIKALDISKGEHLNLDLYKEFLTAENLSYLQNCGLELELDDILLTHTPQDPRFMPWHYIDEETDAFLAFGKLNKKITVIGHTHAPKIFEKIRMSKYGMKTTTCTDDKLVVETKEDSKYILDVGSIGYHRSETAGHYGIIEEGMLELHKFRI